MAVTFLPSFLEIIISKYLSCFSSSPIALGKVRILDKVAVFSLLPHKFLCLQCYFVINDYRKLKHT